MNIVKRTGIAALAAATVLTGAGLGATAASAAPTTSQEAQKPQADIPVTVDPVAIGNAIEQATKTAANRSGFVKDVLYNTYYNAGHSDYNVVVMNLAQDHDALGIPEDSLAGYSDATYDGVVFGVWVFQEGTFVNRGDGGWDNWAVMGVFSRADEGDTKTVTFSRNG